MRGLHSRARRLCSVHAAEEAVAVGEALVVQQLPRCVVLTLRSSKGGVGNPSRVDALDASPPCLQATPRDQSHGPETQCAIHCATSCSSGRLGMPTPATRAKISRTRHLATQQHVKATPSMHTAAAPLTRSLALCGRASQLQCGCLHYDAPIAFRNEGHANSWISGLVLPRSNHIRTKSPEFGRVRVERSRDGPTTVGVGPNVPNLGTNSTNIGQSTKVGPDSTNFDKLGP